MGTILNALLILILSGAISFFVYISAFKDLKPSSNGDLNNQESLINLKNSYSSTVIYNAPSGKQSITIEIELENNLVKDIATSHSMNGKSAIYQRDFQNALKPLVVGKEINDINLSRVGGASITTEAFNKALENIKKSL